MPTAPWWRCCAPCPSSWRQRVCCGGGNPEGAEALGAVPAQTSIQTNPIASLLQAWLPLEWAATPPPATPAQPQAHSLAARLPLATRLSLPATGLGGSHPLAWWAAASYAGNLRRELLRLRQLGSGPDWEAGLGMLLDAALPGLVTRLSSDLANLARPPLLVPIPSWKSRANPLPALISQQLSQRLGWGHGTLLQRSRPVLGQHHLGRQLRWANQAGAFACQPPARKHRGPRQPVLIVDDILTTGATLCGAADVMQEQGWRVVGACCLARTPAKGERVGDLRSLGRSGDGPG